MHSNTRCRNRRWGTVRIVQRPASIPMLAGSRCLDAANHSSTTVHGGQTMFERHTPQLTQHARPSSCLPCDFHSHDATPCDLHSLDARIVTSHCHDARPASVKVMKPQCCNTWWLSTSPATKPFSGAANHNSDTTNTAVVKTGTQGAVLTVNAASQANIPAATQ
jgi:hypothetical protein